MAMKFELKAIKINSNQAFSNQSSFYTTKYSNRPPFKEELRQKHFLNSLQIAITI